MSNENNKRLAKNTIFLYFRMAFLMCIGLYTSRVVLRTLGIADYGLYNLVGSIVIMFSFLNATLSTSTQRFLNIEIGKGNTNKLKEVFSNSLFLHIIIAAAILILAETIGLWYVENIAVIPPGRENAAFWVYQFSIIATCIQIIQLPFMATIIAHESMNAYAYISIYEGIAKLLIVYLIQVLDYDKLILYGLLILIVHISVALFYNIYCQKHFSEARFRISVNKPLLKEMLGFSGWNLTGNFAFACNTQGLNIVLNLFFGTVVNAARGIAFQIQSLVTQFANNFQIAVKPQVIKYYAAGQLKEMEKLVINSAKYSAFMMIILVVPIIVCIKELLTLWLGEYPAYTPIFVAIILLRCIVATITNNIIMVVHATGYLKNISICAGVLLLLVLPVSYLLLLLGLSPATVFIVDLIAAIGEAAIELYFMNKYIKFPVKEFCKKVYLKVFVILTITFFLTYAIHYIADSLGNIYVLLITVPASIILSLTVIFSLGIGQLERDKLIKIIKSKLNSKNNKTRQ